MLASLQWIKDFITLDEPSADVAHRLTMAGIEVEGVERPGAGNRGIIVGRVVSAEPIEGKNLLACRVHDGVHERSVVCGDTSISAGETVAYAPTGSVVNGLEMGERKFGDLVSEGMLCSLADMGLVQKSDEVLRLEGEAGTLVAELIELNDEVWELNITPNRADCLSHWGVARELGAVLDRKASYPEVRLKEDGLENEAQVRIEDEEACPLYTARIIRDVKVGPSPLWVRLRLERAGVRAINNVVDATNLVLLELGQPLHAFDLAKLSGKSINVRRARIGERLTTLDGVERKLDEADLVIADSRAPIALAGVMGGADSEVCNETVDILLESAWFNPVVVRKTARRHGMHTEASHRFERGVDPDAVRLAADRCAQLIAELAGGKIARGMAAAGHGPGEREPVALRLPRIEKWLGISVSPGDANKHLQSIGCTVRRVGEELHVQPPSWRHDIVLEVDLLEEIARLHGYDHIPAGNTATPLAQVPAAPQGPEAVVREWMRDAGFNELVTYSFTSPALLKTLGFSDERANPIPLDKPLTSEQSVMRTSLVPSLLEAAATNLRRGNSPLRLFDVSRVFLPGTPHTEPLHAGACVFGAWDDSFWAGQGREADFYDQKGVLEGLLVRLGAKAEWRRSQEPFLHPGMAADILVEGKPVGYIGVLHPRVLRELDLPPGLLFEIALNALKMPETGAIQAPSRYPAVTRDVAFLVDRGVLSAEIESALREQAPATLRELSLFDVYEGESLGGKKNMAYHLRFQSTERTLIDQEVDEAVEAMVKSVKERCGGELRA